MVKAGPSRIGSSPRYQGCGAWVILAEALLRGAASLTYKLKVKAFIVYKPRFQFGNGISFVYPRYIITSCPFYFFFNM
jgi:hypothetical protein